MDSQLASRPVGTSEDGAANTICELWKRLICPLFEAAGVESVVQTGTRSGLYFEELAHYTRQHAGFLDVIEGTVASGRGRLATIGSHCRFHRGRTMEALPSSIDYDAILFDGDRNWYTVSTLLRDVHQANSNRNLAEFPLIVLCGAGWPNARRDCYEDPASIPEGFLLPFARKGVLRGQSELTDVGGVNRFLLNATQEGGPRNGVLTAIEDFVAEMQGEFEAFTNPHFGLAVIAARALLKRQSAVESCLRDSVHLPASDMESVRLEVAPSERTPRWAELPLAQTEKLRTCGGDETLSVVIVIYNMRREARRSLLSLSSQYQQDVTDSEYEVIVVDNGSAEPLGPVEIERFGKNFRYHYIPEASSSPAPALNLGVKMAAGTRIGLMVDGAHILTPGVLKYVRFAFGSLPNPVIAVRYFFLGPDSQNVSVQKGYNQAVEDQLLASINWPADGYRLFDIGVLANQPRYGWFHPMNESNCFFMRRTLFEQLGGLDERFNLPGGGLANSDLFVRAVATPTATPIVLLGEGSFHQFHKGTTTSLADEPAAKTWMNYGLQYWTLRGHHFSTPDVPFHFAGHMPLSALTRFETLRNRSWDDLFHDFLGKEEEIRTLTRANQQRLELIAQFQAHCGEKDAAIQQLTDELRSLQAVAHDRLALVNHLHEEAACLERACEAKDAAVRHLSEEIGPIQMAADERAALITRLHEEAGRLTQACAEGNARITELADQIDFWRKRASKRREGPAGVWLMSVASRLRRRLSRSRGTPEIRNARPGREGV